MTIREKLIQLRSGTALSQQEFADKLDVTRQTVSRWEAGKSVPSSAQIHKICSVFRLDANTLLDDASPAVTQDEKAVLSDKEQKIEEPTKEWKFFSKKRIAAFIITAAVILALSLAGLIITIIYAVKDAAYDTSATVWIVAIPQNTPMIILSVFLAVFTLVLAAAFIVIFRRGKK